MDRRSELTWGALTLSSGILICALTLRAPGAHGESAAVAVLGNAERLEEAYIEWRRQRSLDEGVDRIVIPLAYSKGRSEEFSSLKGTAELDLCKGEILVELASAAPGDAYDVGLVPYRRGSAAEPRVHVGRIEAGGDVRSWRGSLTEHLGNLELESIIITRVSDSGSQDVAYGTPSLFQRLFSMEAREQATSHETPGGLLLGLASPLATATFAAQGSVPPVPCLTALVAQGENLFFNETFGGNGRTCGTCHPMENNLTIDPEFIAQLPSDDPLFVAEFTPALDWTQNGGFVFEKPQLMREFGLIVENLDGFGDLQNRFVMRGVPHVFAQALSIERGNSLFPEDRTGWSGDGAQDGAGTLRDFATGAVRQHFPKTLRRIAGVDFDLPTPDQLNALEAFQLSLGRQTELDLASMTFLDPEVATGRLNFNRTTDNAVALHGCEACHSQAGANEPTVGNNKNFDTGVEEFLFAHGNTTGRPQDGGFGHTPTGGFGTPVPGPEGYGNGKFNTPSLVELADTLPAFHNNLTNSVGGALPDTVEGSVEFYRSPEFIAEIGDLFAGKTEAEKDLMVTRIGKFLRVINALENERQVRERVNRVQCLFSLLPLDDPGIEKLLRVCVADLTDAVEVLQGVGLHPQAQSSFRQARGKVAAAMAGDLASRLAHLTTALSLMTAARDDMVL